MIATSAWAKRRHNSSLGVGLGGSGGLPAVPVVTWISRCSLREKGISESHGANSLNFLLQRTPSKCPATVATAA
ncbi:unnamed protein product [Ixodes persulcatus]